MASWAPELPDPNAGDDLAYVEAWENRVGVGQPIPVNGHQVNPMPAGIPPVCSCGFVPTSDTTMADHLADVA